MPGMKGPADRLLEGLTQLGIMGGSLMWAWSRLKKDLERLSGEVADLGARFGGEVGQFAERGVESVTTSARRAAGYAPRAIKTVQKQKEGIMGKPKKKFSFLKFLLTMGALIALAIFLLDKFLPKPYRDDELEDAWAGDDLDIGADPAPEAEAADEDDEDAEDADTAAEEDGDEDDDSDEK